MVISASLQTVPKPIEFEVEDSQLFGTAAALAPAGAPLGTPRTPRVVGLNIRAAFVAPPGHLLLAVDYSQVWARLLLHREARSPCLRIWLQHVCC